MKQYNRTKIIATLGPSSFSKDEIKRMIEAGADVFRLNFSHISHAAAASVIQHIRELNDELHTPIAVLADLQGPKLRVGHVKDGGVLLQKDSEIIITTEPIESNEQCISVSYHLLAKDIKAGEKILIDDGNIGLEVIETDRISKVRAKVLYGGMLTSNKGFNLPATKVSLPCLTEKDMNDLEFALHQQIEWIGLSFVRSASDVIELKHIINKANSHSKIIAKIEKPEAVKDIQSIVQHSDAIMIARGDLGVEIDMEKVPMIQKQIIQICLKHAKPVIIATQMMQSMIDSPMPLRAEVNDVANAVLDGADALMLSGETSVGKYPHRVVQTMVKIIAEIEQYDEIYHRKICPEDNHTRYLTDSICFYACELANRTNAKAIVTMTNSGYTAIRTASMRPKAAVFAFTSNKNLLTTLNLVWGVRSFFYDKVISTDHSIEDTQYFLRKNKYLIKGDTIVHTASMPIQEFGMTNSMKISTIE
jgi:pyruvate kinase